MSDWLLAFAGLGFVIGGMAYMDRGTLDRMSSAANRNRPLWVIRVFSALGLLLAGLFLWAAVTTI